LRFSGWRHALARGLPEETREPCGTAAGEIQRQHQHKKQGM